MVVTNDTTDGTTATAGNRIDHCFFASSSLSAPVTHTKQKNTKTFPSHHNAEIVTPDHFDQHAPLPFSSHNLKQHKRIPFALPLFLMLNSIIFHFPPSFHSLDKEGGGQKEWVLCFHVQSANTGDIHERQPSESSTLSTGFSGGLHTEPILV